MIENSEMDHLKDILRKDADHTVYEMYVATKPFAKGSKYPITKSYYNMCEKLLQNVDEEDIHIYRLLDSEDLTTLWSGCNYAYYFDINQDNSFTFTRYFYFQQIDGYKVALDEGITCNRREDYMIHDVLSQMNVHYQYYCKPDNDPKRSFVFKHLAYYRDMMLKEMQASPFELCGIRSPDCASMYDAALKDGKFLKKLQDHLRNDLKTYNIKCSLMNYK